jgi:hypothetical protein
MNLGSPDDDLFHGSLSKLVNRKSKNCKGLKEVSNKVIKQGKRHAEPGPEINSGGQYLIQGMLQGNRKEAFSKFSK